MNNQRDENQDNQCVQRFLASHVSITGEFQTREEKMMAYLDKAMSALAIFEHYSIQQVS